MRFGNIRRAVPAISATLIGALLTLLAAATALADGSGGQFGH